MWMRKWAGLPALLLVVSCGLQNPKLSWPAEVASIDISGDGKTNVATNIETLNKQIGSDILAIGSGKGSPIYIKSVDSFDSIPASAQGALVHLDYMGSQLGARAALSPNSTRVAGRATLDSGQCLIELGSFLFDPSLKDLMLAVLWHEIGHCGGLVHVAEAGEIMSPLTNPFSTYTAAQVKRYFDALLASIH